MNCPHRRLAPSLLLCLGTLILFLFGRLPALAELRAETEQSMETVTAALPIQENDWERAADCPCDAVTRAEKIAAEVMKKDRQLVADGELFAKYLGEERNFSLVEVIRVPEVQHEPYKVEMFRMIGTKIIASYSEYRQNIEKIPSSRLNIARETAIKFYNRELQNMPLIYEGKYAYRPKLGDEKCEVIIEELSSARELLHTYYVDICDMAAKIIVDTKIR